MSKSIKSYATMKVAREQDKAIKHREKLAKRLRRLEAKRAETVYAGDVS